MNTAKKDDNKKPMSATSISKKTDSTIGRSAQSDKKGMADREEENTPGTKGGSSSKPTTAGTKGLDENAKKGAGNKNNETTKTR